VDSENAYRTPRAAQSRAYEVLGLSPDTGPSAGRFGLAELAGKLDLLADELPYHQWDADPATLLAPARRLIEHLRVRYRRDDLSGPLALGALESMALPFETYRLAFPDDLASTLYGDRVDEVRPDCERVQRHP